MNRVFVPCFISFCAVGYFVVISRVPVQDFTLITELDLGSPVSSVAGSQPVDAVGSENVAAPVAVNVVIPTVVDIAAPVAVVSPSVFANAMGMLHRAQNLRLPVTISEYCHVICYSIKHVFFTCTAYSEYVA